jgi:hypothetical protein
VRKRNYRELWEQLKTILMYGGKTRYTRGELLKILTDMEFLQLSQDAISEVLKSLSPKEKKK